MDTNNKAQFAWNVLEILDLFQILLWDIYHKEFMGIMATESSRKTIDDEIPY